MPTPKQQRDEKLNRLGGSYRRVAEDNKEKGGDFFDKAKKFFTPEEQGDADYSKGIRATKKRFDDLKMPKKKKTKEELEDERLKRASEDIDSEIGSY